MKIRLLLISLVTAAAVAVGLQAQTQKEEHTELGAAMENIGKSWRKAKGGVADSAKNADTLAALADVKKNMEEALKHEPAKKADIPAAEQAKFVADYQAKMKEEITKVDGIIAMVKAGKNADAAAAIGVVDQDQKDAHKAFKKQKKKQ